MFWFTCCGRSYVLKYERHKKVFFSLKLKHLRTQSVCYRYKDLRYLNQIHFFDRQLFALYPRLELYDAHFWFFGFISIKISIYFCLRCKFSALSYDLPFFFSLFIISVFQQCLQNSIRVKSSATLLFGFSASYRNQSAVQASLKGGEMQWPF